MVYPKNIHSIYFNNVSLENYFDMLFIFSRLILDTQKISLEYVKSIFNVSGIYHWDIMKIGFE